MLSIMACGAVAAQENSLNTFSPYTLYGVGDLQGGANTAFTGMGGVSLGYRNGGFDSPVEIRLNMSNPASLSGFGMKNFIFDVGLAGSNNYMRQRSDGGMLRSSNNSFNINNITAAMSLARGLGFAVSVSPYSKVGYRIHRDDLSYLADLGVVRYNYKGSGDVNQAKASLGWAPVERLSLGVELNYLWGNIDRTYEAGILDFTGTGEYGQISAGSGVTANTNEKISRMFVGFGVQYMAVYRPKTRLTLGAVYKPGGKLNSTVSDFIPSNNIYGDTIRFIEGKSAARLPQTIGFGAFLHRPGWSMGADWVLEDWGSRNKVAPAEGVAYVNTNTFKLGAQYTPNRFDIRGRAASFFNRMTYKIGVRYGDHYMSFGGHRIKDKAVTLGFDIPFRAMNVSTLNLGFELGERGTLRQGLVRERYFKVNAGVMLFGRDYDYWFEKYKYN